MTIKNPQFYPVMGEALNDSNSILMDMSEDNLILKKIDLNDTDAFDAYITTLLKEKNKKFGVGGYLENRNIYQRSTVFANSSDSKYRNVHLGIDIWSAAYAPVYCPADGVIHSFQDNSGFGNYGPTVIVEHFLHKEKSYSLYGHLSRRDLKRLKKDQKLLRGEKIGHLGSTRENGFWPPHLHFQLIKNLENNSGDYPGVCYTSEKNKYEINCPDPALWLDLAANVAY